MFTWLKIAVRNIRKNSRRSLFTIVAISVGFGAVNVFGGFTRYVFSGLREAYIYGQGDGHLTVFRKGFLAHGKADPGRYLISKTEVEDIEKILYANPEVALVTGQLRFTGLLSNGEVSTIFIAVGRVPSELEDIQSRATGIISRLQLYTGNPLQDEVVYGVGLSSGLAEDLGLRNGSGAIAMAPTVDGHINALDAEVFQVFDVPSEALNDKIVMVPLQFAQSLYGTTGVDRLTVLLKETAKTEAIKAAITRDLANDLSGFEVKTWQELSPDYAKNKAMFEVIFLVLFIIVIVMVIMSTINTMSMAVIERTREIGTLRALGVKRKGIVRLFSIESTVLGVLGSFLGTCLTVMTCIAVWSLEPTWMPANIPKRVPLEVHFVAEHVLLTTAFVVLLAMAAGIVPSRKAARMNIVDALGHV